jgi:hypothetical protein
MEARVKEVPCKRKNGQYARYKYASAAFPANKTATEEKLIATLATANTTAVRRTRKGLGISGLPVSQNHPLSEFGIIPGIGLCDCD